MARVSQVTLILDAIQHGDSKAADELLPLIYEELRRLATHKMAREAPGQTLQPTALVHEAWLRLVGDGDPGWQNRAHFFAAAAEAMRRILVDRARRKHALRHGGSRARVEMDETALEAPADDEKVLQVHDALEVLAAEDSQKAEIVKLRFFGGLSHEEIARERKDCPPSLGGGQGAALPAHQGGAMNHPVTCNMKDNPISDRQQMRSFLNSKMR